MTYDTIKYDHVDLRGLNPCEKLWHSDAMNNPGSL